MPAIHNDTEITRHIEQLFRKESGRLVAVLTRVFGSENLDLAEDVVQDALMEAIRQWPYKGIPDNPSGWLFTVARNKALNIVNRDKGKRVIVTDMASYLHSGWTIEPAFDFIFSEKEILDDQLRMMFTCCYEEISKDSQVALILKTLCGFGIHEIAKAFLTTEENINKRLKRARHTIRENHISFIVPIGAELEKRLEAVLETIYLLFNEGYSASSGDTVIRYELCNEAIRLAEIIVIHPVIRQKSLVEALLALMYLNASRFNARLDAGGNILTMEEQDRSLWDASFMEKGYLYLKQSATAEKLSTYHILAAISSKHCFAGDYHSTDWQAILYLYDKLMEIDNSPVILLNRAVALSRAVHVNIAIEELENLKNHSSLSTYYLYYSTLAEFYLQVNAVPSAIACYEKAIDLAPMEAEKDLLKKRLARCR